MAYRVDMQRTILKVRLSTTEVKAARLSRVSRLSRQLQEHAEPHRYGFDVDSGERTDLPNNAPGQCALDSGEWDARPERGKIRPELPEHRQCRSYR